MRVAEQASRSNKFAVFWVADYIIILFLDPEGYLRKLALRAAWPSFGNSTVIDRYRYMNSNVPFEWQSVPMII
jgi:cellulose synthase/poly-beta-1,6-N-acetylglucosamine synthase-like glycosyltransferase